MKTDTLFYRLFQDRPALVLAVAGIPVPEGAEYSLRAGEIKETAFRLDGLLVPVDSTAGHPLVFLEVQFQPDPAFYARWFAEIFLYLQRRGRGPWPGWEATWAPACRRLARRQSVGKPAPTAIDVGAGSPALGGWARPRSRRRHDGRAGSSPLAPAAQRALLGARARLPSLKRFREPY